MYQGNTMGNESAYIPTCRGNEI